MAISSLDLGPLLPMQPESTQKRSKIGRRHLQRCLFGRNPFAPALTRFGKLRLQSLHMQRKHINQTQRRWLARPVLDIGKPTKTFASALPQNTSLFPGLADGCFRRGQPVDQPTLRDDPAPRPARCDQQNLWQVIIGSIAKRSGLSINRQRPGKGEVFCRKPGNRTTTAPVKHGSYPLLTPLMLRFIK